MVAGQGNPLGYVPVFDGGNPRIVTAKAFENISGGALVYLSGASANVGSAASSFTTADLEVHTNASGDQFVGVAINDTASGGNCAIATRGVVIALCSNTVTSSQTVVTEGDCAIQNGVTAGDVIGRALSSAGSEGFALFDING